MAARFWIDETYGAGLAELGLHDLDSVLGFHGGVPLAVHRNWRAVRIEVVREGKRREVCLKRVLRCPSRVLLGGLAQGRWPRTLAAAETNGARRVEQLGLAAAKIVGWGERTMLGWPGPSFVLTEVSPSQCSFADILQPTPDGSGLLASHHHRRRLLAELGRVVGRLHHAGLRWPELSCANILLEMPVGDEAVSASKLQLINLENIRRSGSRKMAIRELLALLKSAPAGGLTRGDVLRFAMSYSAAEGLDRAGRREVLRRHFDWAEPLWRRLTEASTTEGRIVGGVSQQRGRYLRFAGIRIDDRYIEMLRGTGIGSFKDVFRWTPPGATIGNDDARGLAFEWTSAEGEIMYLRLYRFDKPGWHRQLRRMIRVGPKSSSAIALLRVAERLAKLGVAVPLPVAFGEKMHGFLERRSFVLFHEPAGTNPREWLDGKGDGVDAEIRASVQQLCEETVSQMEARGFSLGGDLRDRLSVARDDGGQWYPVCTDMAAFSPL